MCAISIHAVELSMDFSQSSASVEPCEGALDDPSSGNDFEAFSRV